MDLAFFTNFSASLTAQEAELNTLQEEISSGVAVQTPEQNPSAFETALIGNDQLSALNGDTTSLGDIQGQLGDVSNGYTSVLSEISDVQQLVLGALNGTTSNQNMQSLATQVSAAEQQMLGIANTTGSNGTFLFGGTRGTVQPFQEQPDGSVVYMGDGGQSQAEISSDLSASTIATGEAFISGLQGDGTASVTAASTNTGTGVLLSDGVGNPTAATAFQQGNEPITVSFTTSGTGGVIYTATQTSSAGVTTTLATGPATSGTSLTLGGVDFQLTGTPAAGDSFTISPSRPQSVFTLLSNITTTLQTAGSTPAAAAITRQNLNQDLSALDQYQQTVTTAQAQTGVTLQSLSKTSASNATQETEVQNNVDTTIGTNFPAALTALDQNTTAVEAAMKAFSTVQNLSLFSVI
ncbi:MAG TPA: flagellar hook-associated protein FlgL [Acidocella sp.]|uniref:flagellar hook-associated protein FlgL n=1 Tax=Acidocella sp. TaxID=50710 RepID=UPI002BE8110B|nr:flagellar hook-associated protein FlgL [Acidocella sp.]HVE22004.1 flagellar hook-associated protein FlgL [Acidocella sp.]